MNENKTNINWLITIYPRIKENSYKKGSRELTSCMFHIKIC